VATSGSITLSPATTTLYTAKFTGPGGSVTCSTQVTVSKSTGEVYLQAYTTSYSIWDNTPVGSTAISYPSIHQTAGGVGSYADPITIAVGHSIINNVDIPDFPAGTRFYIPNVRRYFIVEDACGDGNTPQNGPCHTGFPTGTSVWVDMWLDGSSGTQTAVNACASFLTDTNGVAHLIIKNPVSNYLVVQGALFKNGACTSEYGNTPVTM
jgi:hypothetical protein